MTNGFQTCRSPLPGRGRLRTAGSWAAQCLHGQGPAGDRQGLTFPGCQALRMCRHMLARTSGLVLAGESATNVSTGNIRE